MKKVLLMLVLCFSLVCFGLADDGNDTVDNEKVDRSGDIVDDDGNDIFNMKKRWLNGEGKMPAVMFPHTFHQEKNDYKCIKCHDSDEGGIFELEGKIEGTTYKNSAHNFCWTCHKSKNVIRIGHTCSRCHIGPE